MEPIVVAQAVKHAKKTFGNPWKPGQSGNPRGRPKANKYLQQWIRELGHVVPDGQELTWGQLVAMAMYAKAARGDTMAAKLVLDRRLRMHTLRAGTTQRVLIATDVQNASIDFC